MQRESGKRENIDRKKIVEIIEIALNPVSIHHVRFSLLFMRIRYMNRKSCENPSSTNITVLSDSK